jgi:hypothetical protein
MGIRPIRYRDITGAEERPGQEVEAHELHIDQMRLQIDLAAGEYQKLLALLRPYIDARGRTRFRPLWGIVGGRPMPSPSRYRGTLPVLMAGRRGGRFLRE